MRLYKFVKALEPEKAQTVKLTCELEMIFQEPERSLSNFTSSVKTNGETNLSDRKERISERLKSSLQKSELYFSHPAGYNDPLECTIPVTIEDNDTHEEEYRKFYESFLDKRLGLISDDNARRKWTQEMIEFGFPLEKCLMTCLSENGDNQLLWAHYADQHRGICLGYEFPDTDEEFSEKAEWGSMAKHDMGKFGLKLHKDKIQYLNDRPALNISNSDESVEKWKFDSDYLMNACIFSKPKCWEYEKEWRLALIYPIGVEKSFAPKIDTKGYHAILPREWLKEITFGLRLDEKFCEEIVDIVKASGYENVSFRREKIVQGKFEVTSVPYEPRQK